VSADDAVRAWIEAQLVDAPDLDPDTAARVSHLLFSGAA